MASTNYTTRLVAGKPTFVFNAIVTGTPQTVGLSISTNTAPVLATNANVTLVEGQNFNRTQTATDPDNNAVSFSLAPGAPAGLSLTAGGAMTWVPGETNGGFAYPVTIEEAAKWTQGLAARGIQLTPASALAQRR